MAPAAQTFDPKTWQPIKIGPTWQTDEDGDFIMPEYTLGWEIAAWAATWLTNEEGEPWRFTNEQFRFLCWFYEIDANGKFVYADATFQRAKGTGKDPLAAIICMAELIGPCRFSHWHEVTGNPVAKDNPVAHIQLAAVSAKQTENTMGLFPLYIPERTKQHFQIEMNTEKIRALGHRRKLEVITSSYRSQEGARPTFVLMNETHHWISTTGGHDMYKVINRNRMKSKGGASRSLALTNAYMPGEDSIAEQIRIAWEKTQTINPMTGRPIAAFYGTLYDSLEAPGNAPLDPEIIPLIVEVIRGDSVWLDIPTIVQYVLNPTNSKAESRRFVYNQIVADEETLLPPWIWDPQARDGEEGRAKWQLQDGDEIVLGFDGSRTHDATALVAIRISDQFISPIGIWYDGWDTGKKIAGTKDSSGRIQNWKVPRELVDEAVTTAFAKYSVVAFFADVHPWESYVDLWSNRYRERLITKASADHHVGYNMSGHQQDIAEANQRLISAFADGNFFHDGNKILRRHVMNTRKRVTQWGLSFTKDSRESDNHNDAWAATVLAFLALSKYLESGKRPKPKRSGVVHMFR